ncbi:MAG: ribonuclease H [Bowdeniella nasicola]|nr:ribonuclease H [Bowdeniella nasicola]
MTITAACDGSCLGNPGPAGWAWVINDETWQAGGLARATNNVGELLAVLQLLHATAHTDERLHILCDSQYVIRSLTEWLPGWKRRGWKRANKKPVANAELMRALDTAMAGRELQFTWVRGHAGHALNEAADRRANAAATAIQNGSEVETGPGYPGHQPSLAAVDTLVSADVDSASPTLF